MNQHITSDSYWFAVWFNIQGMLIDHENFSWTLGPAFSYNVLWGRYQIKQNSNQNPTWIQYSQDNSKTKDFGVGLISSTEFKNLIARRVPLCFSVQPEFLLGSTSKLVEDFPHLFPAF